MQKFKNGDEIIYHRHDGYDYQGIIDEDQRDSEDPFWIGIIVKNDWRNRSNIFWVVEINDIELANKHENNIAENYAI